MGLHHAADQSMLNFTSEDLTLACVGVALCAAWMHNNATPKVLQA